MYPFFDSVIAPLLRTAGARRIVEIGALRGETTARMLDELGPDAELHVIDPVPVFDPTEHERAFPGRYLFYRQTSHEVLPSLPAMDAALIDGDHNWYTVFHELRLLDESSRRDGATLPVLVLHDVGWPYGRRDLYYAPDQIPDEDRQPYAQQGLKKGEAHVLKRGGMNPTMHNALDEGGERNGVLTALEDFLDAYDHPVRQLILPVYFGLAIVVDQRRLDDRPELVELLDRLESPEGKDALLEMAEDIRLQGLTVQHGIFYNAETRQDRAANRYLNLLKGALLNEHHLEHELRIDHLVRAIEDDFPPYGEKLRDPLRSMKDRAQRIRAARQAGRLRDEEGEAVGFLPYTNSGRTRLDHLQSCLDTIRTQAVKGDLLDVGVGRGGAGIFLRGYLDAFDMDGRSVWMADEFRSSPPSAPSEANGLPVGGGSGFPDLLADLNNVRDAFDRFDLFDKRVKFLVGPPADTLPGAPMDALALLRIGEAGDDVEAVLAAAYDHLTTGGFVVVDRYASPRVQQQVDDFRNRAGIVEPMQRIDWAGACWRKTQPAGAVDATGGDDDDDERAEAARPAAAGPPLVTKQSGGTKDLTVVVVFHNMRREAERTLHSLTRSYQQGIDDLDYEVIAIENGSRPDQKLGGAFVRSFGDEFRYIDIGDDASASPVPALNLGMVRARGRAVALMIDGAHVLTPGVLQFGMLGLRSYEPAVVATQQWYVGPGQQGDAMFDGYDQTYEDRLFDDIEWPSDGYRLFDIGHFIGERDWLDGLWESNCLFAPRNLIEQAGGFDESFAMPGGGYANLELYERLGASPDTTFVTMLGEGSFHQVHGGTTTNLPDIEERHRRLGSYAAHYQELRGRGYRGHGKKIHYVGTMHPDAARTRPRRRTAPNFFKRGDATPAREAMPMPQDLRTDFIDAFWQGQHWRETRWLGTRVPRPPTDLFVYQELVAAVRPDWVIETGTGNGGRALFLAHVLDLVGHGEIVSVDRKDAPKRPEHDRIRYVTGLAHDPATVDEVRRIVGDRPKGLVILGSRGTASKTIREFRAYSPFVRLGSYVVVEDTVINGHPVWPEFGNGPAEAVRSIVEERADFAADLSMEKYAVTFNPGGFLKRVGE